MTVTNYSKFDLFQENNLTHRCHTAAEYKSSKYRAILACALTVGAVVIGLLSIIGIKYSDAFYPGLSLVWFGLLIGGTASAVTCWTLRNMHKKLSESDLKKILTEESAYLMQGYLDYAKKMNERIAHLQQQKMGLECPNCEYHSLDDVPKIKNFNDAIKNLDEQKLQEREAYNAASLQVVKISNTLKKDENVSSI